MIQFLKFIPAQLLGQFVLGFLELSDLVQLDRSTCCRDSQDLINTIFPWCPSLVLQGRFSLNNNSMKWFQRKRCRIKLLRINDVKFSEVLFDLTLVDSIELSITTRTTLDHVNLLLASDIEDKLVSLNIIECDNMDVLEALFINFGEKLRILHLNATSDSSIEPWLHCVKLFGPYLKELYIRRQDSLNEFLIYIVQYCQNLETFVYQSCEYYNVHSNVLQSVALGCPNLRCLHIRTTLIYQSKALAYLDLINFASNSPLLEKLTLRSEYFTDQSVIGLAQHCSKLKILTLLNSTAFTHESLLILSKYQIPLEELNISMIEVPNAEICAFALSRIPELDTNSNAMNTSTLKDYIIPYLTRLKRLVLNCNEDCSLMPALVSVCSGLQTLQIGQTSSIHREQFSLLVSMNPKLCVVTISCDLLANDETVIQLALCCSDLQELNINNYSNRKEPGKVTDLGVLALSEHCRQLRKLNIHKLLLVDDVAVLQLIRNCRKLTSLTV